MDLYLQWVELYCKPHPLIIVYYLHDRYAVYLVLLSKVVPNEESLEIPMFFGIILFLLLLLLLLFVVRFCWCCCINCDNSPSSILGFH